MKRSTMFDNAERLQKEAADMIELLVLLKQLYHHHNSQSKTETPPVSKNYNRELADRLKVYV